jgi:spore germination protein KC/spore germination protein
MSGGGGGEKNFITDTETGITIRDVTNKGQNKLSRRLFFAHRRAFLVSEDMARDVGLREIFDALGRVPGNRLNVNFAIVQGEAYKLLSMEPKLEKYSGEAIREILESETMLGTTTKDVAQMLNQYGVDPIIPYIGAAKQEKQVKGQSEQIQLLGYAMFRDDKMVGVLKPEPSQGLSWLKQDFHPYGKTFEYDGGKISLHVNKGKVKVTPVLLPDHVQYDVKIRGTAYMMDSTAPIDFTDPEQVKKVERKLSEDIRKSLEQSVDAIHENRSDGAQLGLVLARTYPRKWQMDYLPRWREEIKKTTFTYDIQMKISRVGLTSKNISEKVRR